MKMKCAKMQEMLSNAIDNELPENERQIVADHLKVCSECREFYQELKSLDSELDGLEPVFAAENFSRRVIKRLNQQQKKLTVPSSVFENLRNWVAYGAVAGVILLSLFIGNYIGKYLFRGFFGHRINNYYQDPRINGIAESHVNIDDVGYAVYERSEPEVRND